MVPSTQAGGLHEGTRRTTPVIYAETTTEVALPKETIGNLPKMISICVLDQGKEGKAWVGTDPLMEGEVLNLAPEMLMKDSRPLGTEKILIRERVIPEAERTKSIWTFQDLKRVRIELGLSMVADLTKEKEVIG